MRRLDSFPEDGLVWTAAAFGRLALNDEVPSEHLVDLHLYRQPTAEERSNAKALFEVAKIGAGTIPDTLLGDQWVDGEAGEKHPDLKFASGTVIFPSTPPALQRAWAKMNTGEFLIPPWALPIPREAQDAPYIVLPATGNLGEQVIVPTAEIARAWFLRSTMLTLALLSDPVDEAIKAIIDDEVPQIEGENPICLREGFGESDVMIAAALRYSALFRQRASQIRTAIMAASVQNKAPYLVAMPPVVGEFPIAAYGKRIGSGPNRRFLVMRLVRIPPPGLDVPANSIVHYQRQEEEIDPTESASGQRSGYNYRIKPRPGNRPGLGHRDEPNNNISPVRLDPNLPVFDNPPTFTVRQPPPRKRSQGTGPPREGEPPTELSTGAGKWSGDTGPLRYQDGGEASEVQRNRPAAMAATFENVEPVIPRMQAKGCRVWTLSNDYRSEGISPNTRYNLSDGFISNSWVYVGDLLRQLLVIEIESDGGYFYLFDIERRPAPAIEHYTLYFATRFAPGHSPFSRLTFEQIASIIELGCLPKKSGVWRKVDGYQSVKLHHTHSNLDQLATKLAVHIREFRALAGERQSDSAADQNVSRMG